MSKENKNARAYFGVLGDNNYILHHKDPSLKYRDPERYNKWRIEDLVVMTRSDHTILHHTGSKRDKSTCEKISKAKKGKSPPPFTEEHKRKIGDANKGNKRLDLSARNIEYGKKLRGSKWYTNGIKSKQIMIGDPIPEGYYPGMKKRSSNDRPQAES